MILVNRDNVYQTEATVQKRPSADEFLAVGGAFSGTAFGGLRQSPPSAVLLESPRNTRPRAVFRYRSSARAAFAGYEYRSS